MRRCDTIRGREVEDRRKDEEMTAPITLPSLDEPTPVELRRRYARKHQRRNVHTLPDALALVAMARPRARSPKPCCAARTRLCVFSNDTSRVDWMPCRGARPQAEIDGSRRRGLAERLASDRAGSPCCGTGQRQLDAPLGEPQYLGQHTGIEAHRRDRTRVPCMPMAMEASRPTWTDASAKPRRKLETLGNASG